MLFMDCGDSTADADADADAGADADAEDGARLGLS